MKPLAAAFKSGGYEFELVKRSGMIAIYRKRKPGHSDHFETIRIGSHNGFSISGKMVPPAETYPTISEWGKNAFSYSTEEEARAKFFGVMQ